MRPERFLAFLALVLVFAAWPAHARVIRVDARAQGGDGSSWASALPDLGRALDAAGDGDEIWVAAGTYLPQGQGRDASFRLKPGVSVYGGFSGREVRREERDPDAYPTVLSGDLGEPGEMKDNAYHVIVWAERAVLNSLEVSHGFADGRGIRGQGGGLLLAPAPGIEAAMTVSGCRFADNHAREGGAAYVQGLGRAVFNKCRFTGNTAENGGAVLIRDKASATCRDCRFERNSARWRGGAVFLEGEGGADLAFCTFDQNAAGAHGGAVFAQSRAGAEPGAVLEMEKCRLVRNAAQEDGGGVCLGGSARAVLDTCVFKENRAGGNGGALALADSAAMEEKDCSYSGNWAEGQGNDIQRGPLSPALAPVPAPALQETPQPPEPQPIPALSLPAPQPQAPEPNTPKAEQPKEAEQPEPAPEPRKLGPENAGPPDPNQVIKRFDKDGDGRISRSEAPMPMRMDWGRYDKNNDDTIEPDELGLPKTK